MKLKRIDNVPPNMLTDVLRGDAATWGDRNALTRFMGWLGGEGGQPRYLYAIVEVGRVPENLRPRVVKNLKAYPSLPLLTAPGYETIKDYAAWLCAGVGSTPFIQTQVLLQAFGECNSDVVTAFVVSKLTLEELAGHLRHATFCSDTQGTGYVLRWYDPLHFPTLLKVGDPKWVQWLMSPIFTWWYPVDGLKGEAWTRVKGGNGGEVPEPMPLVMSGELWEALVSDPLPYRVVDYVERNVPNAFSTTHCYGIKVAQVEALLSEARQWGLKEQEDLAAFTAGIVGNPARRQEGQWQMAVRQAVAGQTPLMAYFS